MQKDLHNEEKKGAKPIIEDSKIEKLLTKDDE